MTAAPAPPLLPLERLFPKAVATAQAWIGAPDISPLRDAERATLGEARSARLDEFRAGRHCARAALVRLGAGAVPIPRGPDRAPVWPDGVRGSITHVRRGGLAWAAAAVASTSHARGIGLDVELDQPLASRLWLKILSDDERRTVATLPESHQGLAARRFFSAKESLYKAQFPLTGCFLEFHDVEIEWVGDDAFVGTIHREPARSIVAAVVRGRLCRGHGLLVTSATVEPPKTRAAPQG